MEREEVHDLAAAYVLGALDEDERRRFDEHLATCEDCRDLVDELGEVAAALAYAPEGPAPPAALRGRILDAAGAERRKVVPLALYRRRPVWLASAAAAACLAVALGLWATIGTGNGSSRAQVVALQGHVGDLTVTSSGEGTLEIENLAPPPAGAFYQVWVIPAHTKKTVPDVSFTNSGRKVPVPIARTLAPGDTVAVTVETKHLSAPTGPKVLYASLSA